MRGSKVKIIEELCKVIYQSGLLKIDQKIEGLLANADTVETYKNIWDEIIQFILVECKLRDFQTIESAHIEKYFSQKLQTGITIQYAELISSAIGKLEIALNKLQQKYHNGHKYKTYDFSIRSKLLKEAKAKNILKKGSYTKYYTRSFKDPWGIINALENPYFKLAAIIQLFGGARVEAVVEIYKERHILPRKLIENKLSDVVIIRRTEKYVYFEQLQGIRPDPYTKDSVGFILTIEKAGKPGFVRVPIDIYHMVEEFLCEHDSLKINYYQYIDALKKAAAITKQKAQGTHGLRWNYAQNRFVQLLEYGYSTAQAEQIVSWEMKHNRPSITQHYMQ